MQLTNRLDPTLLYRQTYTHLTSSSPISQSGNKYLLDVILKNFSRKKQILEVGCNDLYLLRQLKEIAEHRAGIDPIYEDEQKEISHGIHVKGGFMERINLGDLIKSPIDLLISAHTFEHLANPIQAVINLAPYLSSNCDIIIEVPSSIRMIAQLRLDQVFHQHINYYSPKSLSALLKPLNFKLKNVSHALS